MNARLALVSLATLALTSCGGGEGGGSSSPSSSSVSILPVTPTPTPTPTATPTPTPVPTPTPTVAYGYTLAPAAKPTVGTSLAIGKCVNMGSMLERDIEGDLMGRAIKDADFTVIRKAGFDTVRLPVKYSSKTATTAPYTIDPVFMARVRHVVDAATAAKLNIIIDLHAYIEVMDAPYAERDRFVAIWRQIAEAHKNDPASVSFELLNEPGSQLWSKVSPWEIYTPAIAAIRETNPTRKIVVAGNYGSFPASLANFQFPVDDPNIVPTFHFYEPHEYTHQGAKWYTPYMPIGRRLAESDRNEIDTAVAQVKAYIDRTGRVPFLGEYGAFDIAGTFVEDRVKYYGWVSAAFASIGVQSCAWSWSNNFILYDYKTGWVPGMVESIQTTTTLTPP